MAIPLCFSSFMSFRACQKETAGTVVNQTSVFFTASLAWQLDPKNFTSIRCDGFLYSCGKGRKEADPVSTGHWSLSVTRHHCSAQSTNVSGRARGGQHSIFFPSLTCGHRPDQDIPDDAKGHPARERRVACCLSVNPRANTRPHRKQSHRQIANSLARHLNGALRLEACWLIYKSGFAGNSATVRKVEFVPIGHLASSRESNCSLTGVSRTCRGTVYQRLSIGTLPS